MKMNLILGFHGGHDGSLALVKNGKLIAAISKERITRIKKDQNGNDEHFIKKFLELNNFTLNDITHITFCDDISQNTFFKFYKNNEPQINLHGQTITKPHEELIAKFNDKELPAYHIHHHLSHCAYSFYTSNLDKAICLSMDSSFGYPHAFSNTAIGNREKIKLHKCPELDVGNLYNIFTEKLGLGPGLYKAGTTMGLASYGTILKFVKDSWDEYTGPYYEEYWSKISGLPAKESFSEMEKDSQKAMNIAATLQHIFEQAIMREVNKLYDEIKKEHGENICLSGGSFLNCNVNTKIQRESKFKNVHVSPACGDDGLAAGCALYVAHNILGEKRIKYENHEIMYLGGDYDAPQIGEPYNATKVANMLNEGKIIAWYQGRSEFGPRALGNRSLLANPAIKNMKDILNYKIKKREWFRPFAPSILEEDYKDWFDNPDPSPYMLFTSKVKKPETTPSITHIDNTARIQTVNKQDNPKYYELINEFKKITQIPMLLNTSLNINGEPIVETPEDAIRFLKETKADALVLKDRLIEKKDLKI